MKRDNKNELKDIFSFGDDKVKRFIVYEMGLLKKFETSFNYLLGKFKPQKVKKNLSKLNWDEGKSYEWAYIKDKNVDLIIRRYQNHFTMFCKNTIEKGKEDFKYKDTTFSCFTFNTNRDLLSDYESDARVDNWFYDLENHIAKLIEIIREDKVNCLWNDYFYPRDKFVEIKNVFDNESISSLDLFIFACDELFEKYFELFSTNETLAQLESFNEGDIFTKDFYGDVKIESISTEVEDGYFHGVGLSLINEKGEKKFEDVYSLTRWHYDATFKIKES